MRHSKDLERIKVKYNLRKQQYEKKLNDSEVKLRTQVELHGTEMQRQIKYYRTQVEDLQKKLKSDTDQKEIEVENFLKGSQTL